MLHRSFLPFLITTCLSYPVLAAPLYEVKDEKGNVTYTDKPPSDSTEGDSKTIEQKPMNVLESQPTQDFEKSFDRHRTEVKREQETAWKAYDKSIAEARQQLKSAQAAQKAGEAVREGDMIATHNPSGASFVRPSDGYVARQQTLKRAVDEAQANLDKVLKTKPALRRN